MLKGGSVVKSVQNGVVIISGHKGDTAKSVNISPVNTEKSALLINAHGFASYNSAGGYIGAMLSSDKINFSGDLWMTNDELAISCNWTVIEFY